ncbi:transpeptidase family protein [bacterium SCSIO 12643]|nr:transpeptidase family protein [bacterium SCSIO 12643]
MFVLVALGMVAVLARVLQIQLIEGEEWRQKSENLTIDYRTIDAVRGNIYAVDGSLLATSVPKYEVRFDPNADAITDAVFEDNIDSLSWKLADLFKDRSAASYKSELVNARQKGKRYYLIRRNVKFTDLKAMREFPIFNKGRYKGGFIYVQQNKRQKPFRILAERTIGYDRENGARVGLEAAYRKELRGVSGKRLEKKIAGGTWMPISDSDDIEPQDGYDLVTTIDINIQDVAEAALLRQLEAHQAAYGCVVLMEVRTGEIRAIANLSKGSDGTYRERYNYAIGAATEPGSTIKLASWMALLEDGYVDLDDKIQTGNGKHVFYKTTMYDSHEGGYGEITVKEAFAKSSNIAIAKTVEKYYKEDPQKFINHLYQMRLNKKLGVEISGEGTPYIKSANDSTWSGLSLPWISHGYELELTPLQLLTFYNAVANDGRMMKPMFAKAITNYGDEVKTFHPIILKESVASKETIAKAKEMLEEVVRDGTAKNLRNASFSIAGKTGTAQISKGSSGYKGRKSYQASFCGYFPADKPLYSCIVVVNAPSKNVYYGNLVAGPIFKEIANKVYSTSLDAQDELVAQNVETQRPRIPISKNGDYDDLSDVYQELEVPYTEMENAQWVAVSTGKDSVAVKTKRYEGQMVPNVVGMDVEDAIYLLENKGIKVEIEGRGVVKAQSIAPGFVITQRGMKIKLSLA